VRAWLAAQPSIVHAMLVAALTGYLLYMVSGVARGTQYLGSALVLMLVDGAVFAVAWPLLRVIRGRW
jgi:hypothetical protein